MGLAPRLLSPARFLFFLLVRSQTDFKGSPTDARVSRGSRPKEADAHEEESGSRIRPVDAARGADRRLVGEAGSHDLSVSVFAHKSTRTGRCRFFWAVTNQLQ